MVKLFTSMKKRNVVYTSSALLGLTLLTGSYNKVLASGYYYTDSDYERSSTYAGITDNNSIKTVNINNTKKDVVYTTQDKDAKKVYNTIIVRTKKKQDITKAERQVPVEKTIIQTIPEVTVKPAKQEEKKDTKTNIAKKIREMVRPFRQKTPDDWYLYALGGYTMAFPKQIKMSNTNQTDDMMKKMSGFGFTAGIKIYLNNDKIALFIAPEAFYNKLNLGQVDFAYKAKVLAFVDDTTYAPSPTSHHDAAFPVPAKMAIKTKDMFGGAFRIGFTIMNVLSFYGKASIGTLRHTINGSLDTDVNKVDWDVTLGGVTDITDKTNMIDKILEQWNNPAAKYYLGSKSFSDSKHTLLYGIGAGIELGMWNQHFIMRLDYDHYFGLGTVKINSYYVPWNSNSATKIKIRSSFGVLKLSAGIAF